MVRDDVTQVIIWLPLQSRPLRRPGKVQAQSGFTTPTTNIHLLTMTTNTFSGSLDDAINNFKDVITSLDFSSYGNGLKSASLISQLCSPPSRPPPPVPPLPASYTTSPPPPPTRTTASSIKPSPPPPPPVKSPQSEATFKRLQQKMHPKMDVTPVSNKNVVKNLDKLMKKMEDIKDLPVETGYQGSNDLESKLDNLTNQLKNAFDTKSEIIWENGKPEKFKTCHACQDLIKSETILAGPHTYHQECFTCAHCSQALGDNFYSVDNKNYCEEHKETGLNKCCECQQAIREGGVLVEEERYHLDCFRCSKCQVVLDSNYYVGPDGKFVCPTDYLETLPKCHHCHLPIEEKILRTQEAEYHPACFRCSLCERGLDGVPFILSEGSTNCLDCYKTYKANKCVRCGEAALGGDSPGESDLICNGQTFHRRCYTCHDCHQDLYGKFVCADNSHIICFNCDVKRRSN